MKASLIYRLALNLLIVIAGIPVLAGAGEKVSGEKMSGGGGMDGGGGRSMVCRGANGQIKSAELFDFYEGKVQYKISPRISQESFDYQVEKIVQVLGHARGNDFLQTLKIYTQYVISNMNTMEGGVGLVPVEDSKHVITPPKGCQFEQLANFTSQNQLLINGEIWNQLSETDKAGLVIHEALYKIFRNYGATDSVRVRKSVALLFSGVTPVASEKIKPGQKHLKCHTLPNADGNPFPGSSFKAYNNAKGELVLDFDYIDGQLLITETKINLDKIPLINILNPNDKLASTYWIPLINAFDRGMSIAVSFQPEGMNGATRKILKVGIGNMPIAPTQEFACGPH
jgi:hypothetical protein